MLQRQVAGFISKLHCLLEDPSLSHVIRWKEPQIVILDKDSFVEQVLPKNFRHSRFESFIRQLNLYGFHKVTKANKSSLCFKHENFILGDMERLKLIQLRGKLKEEVKIEEEEPKEVKKRMMNALDSSRTSLRNTLNTLNHRIKRYMRDNPLLESDFKEALTFIKLCQGREEIVGFVPVNSPQNHGHHTVNSVFSFDSRFSLY